ncbi:MAG: tetratricopeptide repeat protein [Thermodesulfobacteriota bacterium]
MDFRANAWLKWRRLLGVALLFILFFIVAFGIQSPGFNARFDYDSAAKMASKWYLFEAGISQALSIFPQRPLTVLTFHGNYLLAGMTPAPFRVLNFAGLAALSCVIVWLVNLVLSTPPYQGKLTSKQTDVLGILIATIFLVHPLQIYVTLYIWQRAALLATLLYCSSLAVYLCTRLGRIENSAVGHLLGALLFVGAMLSKENSFTLPVVLILAEITLFRSRLLPALRRTFPYWLALIAAVAGLSFLESPHGNPQQGSGILGSLAVYYTESGVTLEQVVLTQCRVLFSYLQIIFMPIPTTVQLVNPQIISQSLWQPWTTAPAVCGVLALFSLGVWLIRRRSLAGLGILFFFVTLVPEGLLVPQYAFFGYRAVLPMIGVLLVLVELGVFLVNATQGAASFSAVRVGLLTLTAAVVISLAMSSSVVATIWGDRVAFWGSAVQAFPQPIEKLEPRPAAQVYANLGWALYERRRYAEAAESYKSSIALLPGKAKVYANLGLTYLEMNRVTEAEQMLRESIQLDSELAYPRHNLARLLFQQKRYDEALLYFKEAATLEPSNKEFREDLQRAEEFVGPRSQP